MSDQSNDLDETNLSIKLQVLLSKYDINDRDFVQMLDIIAAHDLEVETRARIAELKRAKRNNCISKPLIPRVDRRIAQLERALGVGDAAA
jgi:hypothetical protein